MSKLSKYAIAIMEWPAPLSPGTIIAPGDEEKTDDKARDSLALDLAAWLGLTPRRDPSWVLTCFTIANGWSYAMAAPVWIRDDLSPAQVRALARGTKDAAQIRRLLAIATILATAVAAMPPKWAG